MRKGLAACLLAFPLGGLAALLSCGESNAPEPMDSPGGTTMRDSGRDTPDPSAGSASAVKAGPPAFRFEDATAGSGIADRVNHSGRAGVKEYLVEAVGPGPSWLDYDHDGRMDLYVPDGDVLSNYALLHEPDPASPSKTRSLLRAKDPRPEVYRDHLYRNLGGGKFEDVSERAGIADERWSFGSLAWDYDGDGWTDLFVANLGKNRLYRNNGNGTFTDVAEQVGLAGDENAWNTCATCGDYDGDGRLDLYVARYSDVAAEVERQRRLRNLPEGTPVEAIKGRSCKWRGLDAYCGPIGLVGQMDSLYRQQGDGTFADVTKEVGAVPRAAKYGFTSIFLDYDGDGLLDVYVANDSEENFLWRQDRKDGKITFKDVSDPLGVKYGSNQNPQASMGLTVADINQDGLIDIFVTNFSHDYNNIFIGHRYRAEGRMTFRDRGLQVMGQAVFYDLAWGCGWYDFDLDADLDLLVANGHVYKEIDLFSKTGTSYEQWAALFECLDAGKMVYREVGPKPKPPKGVSREDLFAGHGIEAKRCSRAAAFCDWDNDGDVDVLLGNMNEGNTLLRNDLEARPDRRWLKLSLRQPGSNAEAVGATITVKTEGGPAQTFPVIRGQSFLGTDDPRIPVGVGAAEKATVTVMWPGVEREKTVFEAVVTNGAYVLHRDGKAERLELPR